MLTLFPSVWTKQMKLKVCFTQKRMCVFKSHFCLLGGLLSVSENDHSAFLKPSGAQEVGHMDIQLLEKCITLLLMYLFRLI